MRKKSELKIKCCVAPKVIHLPGISARCKFPIEFVLKQRMSERACAQEDSSVRAQVKWIFSQGQTYVCFAPGDSSYEFAQEEKCE